MNDAERVLRLLEQEVKSVDRPTRKPLRNVVLKLKKDLKSLRLEYSQKLEEKDRKSLLESSRNGIGFNSKAKAIEQRQRAREGINNLEETDTLLKDSKRLVEESSELGISTMVRIDEQTEILLRTKETVEDTHAMTQSAGKILKQMTQRFCANKCILYIIIAILIVANVSLIFLYKNISPGDKSANGHRLIVTVVHHHSFDHPLMPQRGSVADNPVVQETKQKSTLSNSSSKKTSRVAAFRKRKFTVNNTLFRGKL